jgi:hypothetical protein
LKTEFSRLAREIISTASGALMTCWLAAGKWERQGGSVMASIEEITASIGQHADSDRVRSLVNADGLAESSDVECDEGVPLRWYLSSFAAGYQLTYSENKVVAAFVYVQAAEGFSPFAGQLPGGLAREARRLDVRRQFGAPPPERGSENNSRTRQKGRVGPFRCRSRLFAFPVHRTG